MGALKMALILIGVMWLSACAKPLDDSLQTSAQSSQSGGDKYFSVVEQPQNKSLPEGVELVLQFTVTPDATSYDWYKDGQLLANQNESQLIIDEVVLSDAGQYWVVARGPLGQELRSNEVTVRVSLRQTVEITEPGFEDGNRFYPVLFIINGNNNEERRDSFCFHKVGEGSQAVDMMLSDDNTPIYLYAMYSKVCQTFLSYIHYQFNEDWCGRTSGSQPLDPNTYSRYASITCTMPPIDPL